MVEPNEPRRPRITLFNEGTYPVAKGGVSTWCDQLVTQLPDHDFQLVTVVGQERGSVWKLPDNVVSYRPVAMWDPPGRRRALSLAATRAQRHRVDDALGVLWRAILPVGESPDLEPARNALRAIALESPQRLSWLLAQRGSTEALLAAWVDHRRTRPTLPALSGGDAAFVTRQTDRVLALLDADLPSADVLHVASNGTPALLALVQHWRDGTPIVLTEHGVYLRERYLAVSAAQWPWVVRYAFMAFVRMICRLAYADAAYITPVSSFNERWERRLGADPARIQVIPNGVHPTDFPAVTSEPKVPTVSFVGRIDPLKDLRTLIDAFALVLEGLPDARLRIFGPTPVGNEAYRRGLEERVAQLRLADAVTFEGPISSSRPAFEAGHVVALSSISEGLPFTVIEAMMSGRATVSTDVGGVAECTGRDGVAGVVVPARDPAAMAEALTGLLTDGVRRRAMAAAARERALDRFTLSEVTAAYRSVYLAAVEPPFEGATSREVRTRARRCHVRAAAGVRR